MGEGTFYQNFGENKKRAIENYSTMHSAVSYIFTKFKIQKL